MPSPSDEDLEIERRAAEEGNGWLAGGPDSPFSAFHPEGMHVAVKSDRLKELLEAEQLLNALKDFGVDNWEGYGEAKRSLTAYDE